jgi:RimJ/RimL family protein N-acetyltransferase
MCNRVRRWYCAAFDAMNAHPSASEIEQFHRSQQLTVAPQLESDRLRLREWRSEDLAPMVRMYTDPETMRHLGGPQTPEEIEAFFHVRIERWRNHGWGAWALELRDKTGIVGVIGYGPPKPPFEELDACLDFGWLLAKEYWGQGFATEAAMVALAWGFDDRNLARVIATPDASNHASRHVCEKLHMTQTTLVGPIVVYSVDRSQWCGSPPP